MGVFPIALCELNPPGHSFRQGNLFRTQVAAGKFEFLISGMNALENPSAAVTDFQQFRIWLVPFCHFHAIAQFQNPKGLASLMLTAPQELSS